MSKINILDSHIYNRIAAGEVVERPASIVKELVENSIDAGADFVTINIENGGATFISVSDNGCGIEKDDIEKAFMPHATSKIKDAADLDSILTLGFRGEALCSIAAVSEITLTSRTKNDELAQVISFDHGKQTDRGEAGAPFGTNVTVKNLFAKIPARKKFLQKNKAEEAEITSIISRLILANNTVEFKYTTDGKTIFKTSGKGIAEAVFAVYGMDALKNLFEINADSGDIKISGYISRPGYSKYNRAYQTLMVNGRYIKNADISYAVYNCFKDYLMTRQYPMYVLFIGLPPDMVDINVHPGKTEAKFAAISRIISLLKEAISKSLYGAADFDKPDIKNGKDVGFDKLKTDKANADSDAVLAEFGATLVKMSDLSKDLQPSALLKKQLFTNEDEENRAVVAEANQAEERRDWERCAKTQSGLQQSERRYGERNIPCAGSDFSEMSLKMPHGGVFKVSEKSEIHSQISGLKYQDDLSYKENLGYQNDSLGLSRQEHLKSFDSDPLKQDKSHCESDVQKNIFSGFKSDNSFEGYGIGVSPLSFLKDCDGFKRAGKLFDTYILIEKGNNVFIIDQHAAHERLIYDAMYKRAAEQSAAVQTLLVPYFFSLTFKDAAILDESLKELENCGFIIKKADGAEQYTWCDYYIYGVPLVTAGFNESVFITELMDMIREGKISNVRLVRDKIIMASCKAAVKGKDDLSDSEINALLKSMAGLGIALCPHGRPAVITLPRSDIEKWFKRKI